MKRPPPAWAATATVRQNADNAQQASGVAHVASEVAARGSDLVGDVVETMRELAAGSKRMTDIIAVIEGIAFQTNIWRSMPPSKRPALASRAAAPR